MNMMASSNLIPQIIQGGMGAAVSNWILAKAVSKSGMLGVVSGTALDCVMVRRLQDGDIGGHIRRALAAFPIPDIATRVLDKYFIDGGKKEDESYSLLTLPGIIMKKTRSELMVVANYVSVYLAKEGHKGMVGINYLEKIQIPNLASIYGAMLAGVDVVLMGAGIPIAIPGILDKYAAHEPADMKIHVEGNDEQVDYKMTFDPSDYIPKPQVPLKRPDFLAIISSEIVAKTMMRRVTGKLNGFVVENFTAGGHNAPPRRAKNNTGEPGFTDRDIPNLKAIEKLGLPFWLAGSYGTPEKLAEAKAEGAAGVQIGTAFAYCNQSGIEPSIKKQVIAQSVRDGAVAITDFVASPTGYPFKMVKLTVKRDTSLEGSVLEDLEDVIEKRARICDLGYLRTVYVKDDGKLGYRCPSEPIDHFVKKGGTEEGTKGKQCLCNGLMSVIGMAQTRKGIIEPPVLTAGDDVNHLHRYVEEGATGYNAIDVIQYMLGHKLSEVK